VTAVPAPESTVIVDARAPVAMVRLNRPDALNALTPEMIASLRAAIARCDATPAVRGLVICGEGRAFCAGADIHFEHSAGEADFATFIDDLQDLTRALRRTRLYVVAALNGLALGGGFELAMACDARVAHPKAVVGFPEITLGLTVTGGVTFALPRVVGASRALELLVSGRSVVAREARHLRLVDLVSSDPIQEAQRLAGRAEAAPEGVVALVKQGLYAGEQGTLEDALAAERETIVEAFARPGARKGLRAFVERHRGPPRSRRAAR
jgi:enoyl-CoA hydratase/carnithine racemase